MAQLTSRCAQSPCWKESSRTNIMNEAEGYFLLYLIAVRLCMSDVVDSWNVGGQTIYDVFVAATGRSGELSDESLSLITIGTLDAYVLIRMR